MCEILWRRLGLPQQRFNLWELSWHTGEMDWMRPKTDLLENSCERKFLLGRILQKAQGIDFPSVSFRVCLPNAACVHAVLRGSSGLCWCCPLKSVVMPPTPHPDIKKPENLLTEPSENSLRSEKFCSKTQLLLGRLTGGRGWVRGDASSDFGRLKVWGQWPNWTQSVTGKGRYYQLSLPSTLQGLAPWLLVTIWELFTWSRHRRQPGIQR